jgi:hypothetical protein
MWRKWRDSYEMVAVAGFLFIGATVPILVGVTSASAGTIDPNQETVDKYSEICKESHCYKCGLFFYENIGGNKIVRYAPSFCESDYMLKLERANEIKVDAEIRVKYAKDGGN